VESVLNKICDKLVYRHPHIYGDVKADDEETVKANWEKLKLKEFRPRFQRWSRPHAFKKK
jgi:XTP/dITP diphosphohydrolase